MYIFQSLFNLVVTSNSGQAALTMPIMAPLADLVGVSRQIAVLAYQLGAGFVDAFTPVSASLIGVLGVARIDWGTWAKFQIKMQAFFFAMGTVIIAIAGSDELLIKVEIIMAMVTVIRNAKVYQPEYAGVKDILVDERENRGSRRKSEGRFRRLCGSRRAGRGGHGRCAGLYRQP